MSECKEAFKVKHFIEQYKKVLENYLNPLALLEHMADLKDEVYLEVFDNPENHRKQVDIFLRGWQEQDDEKGSFKAFLNAVNACQDQKWLHPLFSGSISAEDVGEFFNDMENLETVKHVFRILKPELDGLDVEYCIDVIRPYLSSGENDYLKQKCLTDGNHYAIWWLTCFLLRKEKNAMKEFCNHLRECNHQSSAGEDSLVNIILECFNPSSSCLKNNVEADTEKEQCGFHETKVSKTDLTDSPSQQHAEAGSSNTSGDLTDDFGQMTLNVELPHREEPQLRNYQMELVELAEQGKNVIISAPPGSGKTIVAWRIVKKYLESNARKKAPVLMFTPGGALATQQSDRLKDHLPKEFTVELMSGSAGHSTFAETMEADVIVLTPQILLNELAKRDEPKAISGIDQFGLFIFDECHRCTKDHPYNGLMKKYFVLRNESKNSVSLPQIVGLSATLGIGQSSSLREAVKMVKLLCANLNAVDGIVSVKIHLNELMSFIPQPDETMITLETRSECQFYSKIISLMNEVKQALEDIVGNSGCPLFGDDESNRQAFKQWCAVYKDKVSQQTVVKNKEEAKVVHTYIDYLKQYNEALELHLKCEAVNAVEHMEEWLHKQKLTTFEQYHELEKIIYEKGINSLGPLKTLAEDKRSENPNLITMEELILQKFRTDENSKGMIMVEMRKYTHALKKWAAKREKLKPLNAEIFTGTGRANAEGDGALTHQQQKQTMENFREGKHKVLICTPDSAGEGIDVVDCNFVIVYDIMTNEITTTQIKGRARKKGGEVYQLSSPRVACRDHLNKTQTELMEKARAEVEKEIGKNLPKYQSDLVDIQNEQYQLQLLMKNIPATQKTDIEYVLQCKKCSLEACSSYDIRAIELAHHICIHPDFERKYQTKVLTKKINFGIDWEPKNNVLCKSCGEVWGIECEWKGVVTKALIQIRSFKLLRRTNMEGRALTPKKWKDVPFSVQEPTTEEITI